MRLALISDIHGNRTALEAVLADIHKAGVDHIICLGDVVNIGPHPSDCLDIVCELNGPVLQGNHELYLLGEGLDEEWRGSVIGNNLRWTQERLRPEQFDYMRQLPLSLEISADKPAFANGRDGYHPATFFHGSPASQFHGILPWHTDSEIAEKMNGMDDVTLFVSHTHRPLFRPWSKSWIINIGSVGMPLDGNPLAKYVIATQQRKSWQVEFRMVEYDVASLMHDFDQSGLQAAGGVVTAVFRYQMLTGQPLAIPYFLSLHQRAETLGISVSEAYIDHPIPPQVQAWCL